MTELTNEYDLGPAATYDEDVAEHFAPSVLKPTLEFLGPLADGGALEFAIGTGRVGLALSQTGVDVSGIELSAAMLDQLKAKPGAEHLELIHGDMASAQLGREFSLVYLVFNTIMNLRSQDEQVACFRNAAAHLSPGGHFVVEVLVPRLRELPPGERVQAFDLSDNHLGFDRYTDFTNQILESHHYRDQGGVFQHDAASYRWVWPSELDLMGQLAGMSLAQRWADWDRSTFTDDSEKHVSVWRKEI